MIGDFLTYKLLILNNYTLTVQEIVNVVLIIFFTKIILLLIKKALFRFQNFKDDRIKDLYTLNKIISYVIWTISAIFILSALGLKITALLTGSAALLVGIGLGLQQTFNDFISGVILLFEGKTKVGDLLEIEGKLMQLQNIGLRTTEGVDRDGISIIIPNSKIVTDKVINWTHQEEKKLRFKIKISIAYGSDVELAIKILESCAKEHSKVVNKELVEARFVDFGSSSLDFELLFFSKTIFRIEKIKSEIRRTINLKLSENNITIPFPQMDIHIQSEKNLNNNATQKEK